MIQVGTSLKVIDNSGAREVGCIGVLAGYRQRYAYTGDVVTVSVKKLRTRRRSFSKVKKGDVLKALLVRVKNPLKTKHGALSFFENSVVLINQQGKLIGTRVFGALPKYLRYTKHMRLVSLAAGLVN
jgi:large subunit ribosomal protein L14